MINLKLEVCDEDGSCVKCGPGYMKRQRGKGKWADQGCGYNPRPVGVKVIITAPAGLLPDGHIVICEARLIGESK